MQRFYITTPIYYVNAKPHLGHAYSTIVADSLARFHRALDHDTYFLTGTDEHGDKIVQAAEKAGLSPAEYTDRVSAEFKSLWPKLGITNDDFIRTTEARHREVVQQVLQKVFDAGDIYFGEYGGHYCYGCERFLTEKELVDGKCPDHQVEPEKIVEKNYFFRMSKYQQWLIDHIKANPDFIRPQRYRTEVLSLLESGVLEDLCISRPKTRLTWGIELPFDADYVCYVWFDALINYVSALDWPEGAKFDRYWPAAQHLVAKDILKPHAVFWPTMLRAAGIEVYDHLNVHGYWLVKETKMSKSLGNVVEPLSMVDAYGLDVFRYYLLREMHFGHDASFSEEGLVARLNADLANDLGNLMNRTLAMTQKYFKGLVPNPASRLPEDELRELAETAVANYVRLFSCCSFARALESLWELVRGLNRYIDSSAPWELNKKGDTEALAAVMYAVLECLRKVAACLLPVMPDAAAEMLAQLGANPDETRIEGEETGWGLLAPGAAVARSSNLFPRVDLERKAAEAEPASKPAAKPSGKTKAKAPEEIEFADFAKLDLRMGRVVEAAAHPDADRLLVLQVDVGEDEPRQVVAGLAEHYAPEDLKGREVAVVANLKPAKLRGQVSRGMVLAVSSGPKMHLLASSGEVSPGDKIS